MHADEPASSRPASASGGRPAAGEDATAISAGNRGSSVSRAPVPVGRGATTEIGRLLEGTMLGPYRLEEFIGGGGMGAVFRALDTTLDRIVAVKVLARQASDDEEMLRRFRNEAQSAARLDHENIGRVHAVGSEGDWHYIVFEYIEGTNIRDLVREQGPFDPGRTIDVAIQVADALEHASQREIVHRDIKPSNIVITPAGRARIVDMGLARLHQMAGDADLTVSGMTLGTFDYISPEQARDPREADVRSDLYSLGCTMFFMLAGRPPFAEGTMVQKLLQHQQTPAPAIDEIRPDVPHRLAAILARLMEKDPADRYQRPAVLVADLVSCAETEGVLLQTPRPVAIPLPEEERRASRLPWLVPALLLAALVGGLWLWSVEVRRGGGEASGEAAPVAPAADGVGGRAESPGPAVDRPLRRVAGTGAEVAAATAAIGDGGTIEIDRDGVLDLPPLAVNDRRLTIRAAVGRQPILRVQPGADGAAVRLAGGELVLRNLALHLGEPAAGGEAAREGRRSLVQVSGGRLTCEAVVLRMPGDPDRPEAEPRPAAFVTVAGSSPVDAEIVLAGVRAAGGADLLGVAAPAGGRISIRWDAGAVVTPRRLMMVEGALAATVLDGRLENVVAACGGGLVASGDSAALPVAARLAVIAAGCRFIVTDPARPFVEQSGIAAPDHYVALLEWQDRHGRYEGGDVFRRIDGAAERVDLRFGDRAAPPVHESVAGGLPVPVEWGGWGS